MRPPSQPTAGDLPPSGQLDGGAPPRIPSAPLVSGLFFAALALCWIVAPLTYVLPWLKVAWAALFAIPLLPLLIAGRLGLQPVFVIRLSMILAAGVLLTAISLVSGWANGSDPGLTSWHILRYAGAPCLFACLALAYLGRSTAFPHQRACDLLLGLCALQIPVYLVQKYILFPEGTTMVIFDQWSGTFPRSQDSSMAFVANLTLVYCLHLRMAGAFTASWPRLLVIAGTAGMVIDQHSEINRVIFACLAAAAIVALAGRRLGPRWTAIMAGAVITIGAIAVATTLVELTDQVGYLLGWVDDRGYWRYIEGVQNDRVGGLIYLLRADHPALGFGPGVISYPFAIGEANTVGQTRGILFAPYLELGWAGVLATYALVLAHLGRPANWAGWCLLGSILLMSLAHEITPSLTLLLALHIFAACFTYPVAPLPAEPRR